MNSTWLKDTAERVVRTFAASLAAFLVGDVTIFNVDWTNALAVSGTTALATLLLCVTAKGSGVPGTAAFSSAIAPNDRKGGYPR